MTESSWPWDGTSTGDGSTAPYSSSEYAQFVRTAIDDHGVAPNARLHIPVTAFNYGSLLVTGTATPVSVAAGYAYVAGYTYISDAAVTHAIATPATNPRIDRIVLRIDWAAQTIRTARLAGAEAAIPTPPAMTQTIGTTYEVSLAQVNITTGGVITVRDERPGFMGLGPGVFFRDIRDRVFEEFFDNFGGLLPANAGTASPWQVTIASGAVAGAGGESAVQLSTSATNARTAQISYGNAAAAIGYPLELSKAPLLFEARMAFSAAFDAQSLHLMRINSAAGGAITFGMIGSVSTTALVLQSSNAGPTNFTTGQAGDATGAYHTYGIYLPAAAGPAIAFYDGVAIGQVSATLPATTTDVTAQFFVGNGTTAADRVVKVDWARWVRGAN